MRTTLLCAALLVSSLVLAVPSASALAFVPPPAPAAKCEPWPEGDGGGVEEIVHDTLNDTTDLACNRVRDANTAVGIAYTFTMTQVGIVVALVAPTVDATQDNYCTAMYGEPNPDRPECEDIVVRVDPVMA